MIVIDIGCAPRERQGSEGIEESIPQLIERFHPSALYGFDPGAIKTAIFENGCRVLLEPAAAWIYDGFIGFEDSGITSRTCEECGPAAVPCFDLATFIADLPDAQLVLKIDAEGAEHVILPHLHETGADALIDLLLVEWHGDPLDLPLRTTVELW